MRQLTIGLLALALLTPAGLVGANPKELRIASGQRGGTYRDVYGPNLGKLMYGYDVLQITTSGSGENLERLIEGRADLGFAQADVLGASIASDARRYGELLVLGKLGDECLYLATQTDGPVKSLEQLAAPIEGRPARISVGAAEGGAARTWQYLGIRVPGLDTAEVRNEDGTLALNRLAVGANDAVLWVTDPTNYDHYNLRTVLANKALDFVPLTTPALLSTLPDGTHVYRAQDVKLTGKWRAPKLSTVCTSALVLARKDADPKLIERVSNAIALQLELILPKEP